MKNLFILLLLLPFLSFSQPTNTRRNIFIITVDGFRWQEVFKGADSSLLADQKYVKDTGLMRQQFWSETGEERRKKLLPFFWNVINKHGQLFGNRDLDNNMDVANLYKISYPGYNEIFTGFADNKFIPNLNVRNKNANILEFLNATEEYHSKVAAFSSWSVLPFILDEKGTGLPVNSGYEALEDSTDTENNMINTVQLGVTHKTNTRHDQLTYVSAKTFIEQHHPRVLYLGLGETDESAHKGEYDRYLQKAHQIDEMIAELWYNVQTDAFYRDNTIFIITTDHGRGAKKKNWNTHGFWVPASGQTWMAILGPGIAPSGEQNTKQQTHQKQIASTISLLLEKNFVSDHRIGKPIPLEMVTLPRTVPPLKTAVASTVTMAGDK